MKAKIKEDAPEKFLEKSMRIFHGELPDTYREYYMKLVEYRGIEMDVLRIYGNRVVLKYPQPEGNCIGIDVEIDLVEFLSDSKEVDKHEG